MVSTQVAHVALLNEKKQRSLPVPGTVWSLDQQLNGIKPAQWKKVDTFSGYSPISFIRSEVSSRHFL